MEKGAYTAKDVTKLQKRFFGKAKAKRQRKPPKLSSTTLACPMCRAKVPKEFVGSQEKHHEKHLGEMMMNVFKRFVPVMVEKENVLWFELGRSRDKVRKRFYAYLKVFCAEKGRQKVETSAIIENVTFTVQG